MGGGRLQGSDQQTAKCYPGCPQLPQTPAQLPRNPQFPPVEGLDSRLVVSDRLEGRNDIDSDHSARMFVFGCSSCGPHGGQIDSYSAPVLRIPTTHGIHRVDPRGDHTASPIATRRWKVVLVQNLQIGQKTLQPAGKRHTEALIAIRTARSSWFKIWSLSKRLWDRISHQGGCNSVHH